MAFENFHENSSTTFWVIQLTTNQPTNKQRNKCISKMHTCHIGGSAMGAPLLRTVRCIGDYVWPTCDISPWYVHHSHKNGDCQGFLLSWGHASFNQYTTGTTINKKLSYRKETVRCFLSLNILLNHSDIWNDTLENGTCKSLLIFHCKYVSH